MHVQSEYSTSDAERRHFMSRFTGSAGTAVVTVDAALLWTDGRYFLQVLVSSFASDGDSMVPYTDIDQHRNALQTK